LLYLDSMLASCFITAGLQIHCAVGVQAVEVLVEPSDQFVLRRLLHNFCPENMIN
jgi:hypothetical protein